VVAVPLIVVPDSQPVCVCAWWADIWTDSIDSADYVKMSQLLLKKVLKKSRMGLFEKQDALHPHTSSGTHGDHDYHGRRGQAYYCVSCRMTIMGASLFKLSSSCCCRVARRVASC
jgi:hypothetical protein